jgi:hypothetical protein
MAANRCILRSYASKRLITSRQWTFGQPQLEPEGRLAAIVDFIFNLGAYVDESSVVKRKPTCLPAKTDRAAV